MTKGLKEFLRPGASNPELADRKSEFDDICRYVDARQSWVTSVRGEAEVRFETLAADSPLADELRAGAAFKADGRTVRLPPYKIMEDGFGERITGSGAIVKTRRYSFELP